MKIALTKLQVVSAGRVDWRGFLKVENGQTAAGGR
jgi:hypothetical protein